MVHFCAIYGCSNRSNREKNRAFFRLPAVKNNVNANKKKLQLERQKEWLRRIGREDLTPEQFANALVCSDDFVSGKPADLQKKDDPDWAPSLNLGHNNVKTANTELLSRYHGITEKKRRSETANVLIEMSRQQPAEEMDTSEPKAGDISTQTDTTVNELRSLEEEVNSLCKENAYLKNKLLKRELNEDAFKDDDEKVLFYTGLPNWQLFLCLYHFVSSFLSQSSRCMLSPFQRLILTLMRMRLNLSGKDLAYRFGGIHETTVSRIFVQVVDVLHSRLSPIIQWPDRDALFKTMPMDFRKNYPACAVIIDCFEIFIDRASNPLARAQTFSSYKHHNTVKYLIGITPQGSVSFISDGWGGRVSDKHLTEECGLLEKLIPGDVVLADRDFDIQESVGLFYARVKIPAFTKGKKQLSGIEVEQTRQIANVRIHVERVIGNIRKKYGILSATQPIDLAVSKGDKTTLDKIVTVGCALNNICDSVIPFE